MSTERERRFVGPRRGQLAFALFLLAVSLLLLSQIWTETRWTAKTKLYAQPRFWPAVSLGLMAIAAGLHLHRLPWRRFTSFDKAEVMRWVQVLEFAGWFMVYVLAVPLLGYLPVTLVFVPALCWRMGYRDRRILWISAVFAVVVVVVFKAFLSVKIPGAAVYEYLPGDLRTFFILNF